MTQRTPPVTEPKMSDTDAHARPSPPAAPSQDQGADLVFVGKLTELTPVSMPGTRIRWTVKMAVKKVVSGRFSGDTFSFGVHSPTKSGLVVGGAYEVRATETPEGYVVDELQWGLQK